MWIYAEDYLATNDEIDDESDAQGQTNILLTIFIQVFPWCFLCYLTRSNERHTLNDIMKKLTGGVCGPGVGVPGCVRSVPPWRWRSATAPWGGVEGAGSSGAAQRKILTCPWIFAQIPRFLVSFLTKCTCCGQAQSNTKHTVMILHQEHHTRSLLIEFLSW